MATWYISPTGNDTTGDGSSGNPWLTVGKAWDSSANGDTVICKNGTYPFVTTERYGSALKGIILQAEKTGSVFFDGTGQTNPYWRWGSFGTGAVPVNTSFIGITFQNITETTFMMHLAANTTCTSCVFKNIVVGDTSGIFFDSNFPLHMSSPPLYTFSACVFNNVTSAASNATIITQFTAYYSLRFVFCDTYWAFKFPVGTGTNTYNDNVFYNTGVAKALFTGAFAGTFSYNDTYNYTTIPAGAGNITSDPLFVDAVNGNFNLRPTSPCLGTGIIV